ncbi:response regulator transcription factor [Anaerovorax odorimutans]|uniref:Stage 0 sporulation protein A homolog n=1 Tax=Anaerovorax odorimutans TaxID=109327 RepID=A0ABT1RQN9_9FIRM|nr:response regulator transcription factor [Anaerovorax odorimutans]MCQ4637513.1 response regulator transcription factor [Anaerovorax odorimutans]
MRLLIAEDEKNLNKILTQQFKDSGYSVDSCLDGSEALDYIAAADYDAIVLDIMMPKVNGLDVLRQLRSQGSDTPVLFLTARDSISDRVEGLDLGADDYLTKPFAFEELLARVRVLTRKKNGSKTNIHTLADLTVNSQSREVKRGDTQISLSSREFSILEYMIMNKNMVLSRDTLERHVVSYDYEGSSNMIDVYIRYLRKKIDDGYEPKLIHTVRGAGYVLKVNEK